MNNLLLEAAAPAFDIVQIAIIVVAALTAIAFLLGLFRKFSRISWGGVQALIVFAITLLVPLIVTEGGVGAFVLGAAVLIGGSMLAVLLGGGLRGLMRRKHKRPGLGVRFLDRLFGGIMGAVNFIVPFAAIVGAALASMRAFGMEEVAGELFANEFVANVLIPNALDLFLATFFVAFVHGGYKLGLARGLWALIAVALTIGVVIASLLLVLRVGFVANIATSIANCFPTLNPVVATVIGFAITFGICCLILLAVVILIYVLINLLVKRIDRIRPLRFIDGAIMALVFSAIALVVVVGFNYGMYALATLELPADLGEMIPPETVEQIQQAFTKLGEVFTSSPLAKIFYESNPIVLAMSGGA